MAGLLNSPSLQKHTPTNPCVWLCLWQERIREKIKNNSEKKNQDLTWCFKHLLTLPPLLLYNFSYFQPECFLMPGQTHKAIRCFFWVWVVFSFASTDYEKKGKEELWALLTSHRGEFISLVKRRVHRTLKSAAVICMFLHINQIIQAYRLKLAFVF